MTRRKQPNSEPETKIYWLFGSNLHMLAYFLGTTEKWYEKQVRVLEKKVQKARKDLSQAGMELEKLGEKMDHSGLSEVEEKQMDELIDKVEDLGDADLFMPIEADRFCQFSDLIRVLGLVYLVAIFEGYIADIVRKILLAYPGMLRSGRQLTAETVFNLGGRKRVMSYLAEREAEKLRSFPDTVNYFNKKFDINLNDSGVSAERVVEIMATRNIHVHNGGKVDHQYLELVKGSKLKVGAYKSITSKYLQASFDSIRVLIDFINAEVQRKYFAGQGN